MDLEAIAQPAVDTGQMGSGQGGCVEAAQAGAQIMALVLQFPCKIEVYYEHRPYERAHTSIHTHMHIHRET